MLEVRNLSKVYYPKKGAPVTALNSVNLKFSESGLVFLLGKSGSGKSTLLNLIGGLDSYTGGEIVIKGKSSSSFKPSDFDSYRNTFIGFIFQEFYILEDYSVARNIGLAMELQHKKADEGEIENILSQVDLAGFGTRRPNELSGGQKQRIAIARALIKNPQIIMADEPTGSLDSATGKQVFETLQKLGQTKLVIVVSHDRENAEKYGDRIIELADGNIISDRVRSLSGGFDNMPVKIINENLIHVQAGHKLTTKDTEQINQLLQRSKGGAFISAADENAAKEYGTKKGFVTTSEKDLNIKTYNPSDFKLVKSRLPFKDSLRMGASGLKLKKLRLAFTIILSFVAILFFGASNTLASFSSREMTLQTLYDKGIKTIKVESRSGTVYNDGYMYLNTYDAQALTKAQTEKIESLTGKKTFPVIKNSSVGLKDNFRARIGEGLYFTDEIAGLMEIESGKHSEAGLTLLTGKLPTGYDEIAITDYTADSFLEFGYKKHTELTGGVNINSYNELLTNGAMLNTVFGELKIVGVFKTEINKEDYYQYKTSASGFAMQVMGGAKETVMNMGFVKPGLATAPSAPSFANVNWNLQGYDFSVQNQKITSVAAAFNTAAATGVFWANGAKTALDDNEIILGASCIEPFGIYTAASQEYMDYLKNTGSDTVNFYLDGYNLNFKIVGLSASTVLVTVNEKTLGEIHQTLLNRPIELFGSGFGGFSGVAANVVAPQEWNNFAKYTSSMQSEITWIGTPKASLAENEVILSVNYFSNFIYGKGNGQNEAELIAQVKAALSGDGGICSFGRIQYRWDGSKDFGAAELLTQEKTNLKVVGINLSGQKNGAHLISGSFFDELQERNYAPVSIIVQLSGNRAKDLELLTYLDESLEITGSYASDMRYYMDLTEILTMLDEIIGVLKTVLLWLSVAFSVFAGLLLMNFIGVSVAHKKKDIGILRAIGARGTDVFRVFMYEGLIIAIVNFLLATIGLLVTASIVNAAIGLAIFLPNILTIILMAALCTVVTVIATFVPVQKFVRQKPIDAINNR